MAHLCLENSLFYEGTDFTEHSEVNSLIQDAQNHCVVLFPGKNATSISRATAGEYYQSIAKKKRLVIFVIDGTWAQAKRMRRLSQNLHGLPHLAFLPETPSHFLVRQQPAEFCYSTIESIHSMIDWMEKRADKRHENLLEVFSRMVNQQVQYEMHYGALRGFCPTRGLRVTSKVELPPA